MFKSNDERHTKGEVTRQRVLATALRLFRRRGFGRTTMRDIARAAGLSIGAAYHYFPSKDDIVMAYYERMQGEHERLARPALSSDADLGKKLQALFDTKLDLLRHDRKILGALFGNLGDPSDPLSVFGTKTASIRARSIALFVAAFEDPSVPRELRRMLGRAVWLAHLGVFLFSIHDASPNRVRTRRLVGVLVDLVASGAPLLAHPMASPIRQRLLRLVSELAEAT
jgi:AcrR family transcriptional regulator